MLTVMKLVVLSLWEGISGLMEAQNFCYFQKYFVNCLVFIFCVELSHICIPSMLVWLSQKYLRDIHSFVINLGWNIYTTSSSSQLGYSQLTHSSDRAVYLKQRPCSGPLCGEIPTLFYTVPVRHCILVWIVVNNCWLIIGKVHFSALAWSLRALSPSQQLITGAHVDKQQSVSIHAQQESFDPRFVSLSYFISALSCAR